jgi:hypothetical protein
MIRFSALSASAAAVMLFMLARYGLRGIFYAGRPFRMSLFALLFIVSMLGGFRGMLISNVLLMAIMFFLEGLHRTRLLPVAVFAGIVATSLIIPFARQLPFTFQRSLAFLPLDIDPVAKANAESSSEWRLRIWQAMYPKVPGYLLLGKGYALTARDFDVMGNTAFGGAAGADASEEGLAVSNDFHSGPLSTLICFGAWGAISILAIMFFGLRIMYLNFRHGDPDLRTVNALILANQIAHIFMFFVIFGVYNSDVGYFGKMAGFSVALNWGVCRPKPVPAVVQRIKPLPETAPQPA